MIEFDPERVRANVQKSSTEDLLDRITAYRPGMEPEALDIIERELHARGIHREQIEAHEVRRERERILLPDGTAACCTFCHRPAVAHGWDWHLLWGVLPLFPRTYFYCAEHRPATQEIAKGEG